MYKKASKVQGLCLLLLLMAFFYWPTRVLAESAYGYQSIQTMIPGSLVGIATNKTDQVSLAHSNSADTVIGVVSESSPSVYYTKEGANVPVVTNGDISVFTTTMDGSIRKGDKLMVSEIAGVAKRAVSDNVSKIIGVAASDLNDQSVGAEEINIEGLGDVTIGKVVVHLGLDQSGNTPAFTIRNVAEKLIGRPISLVQAGMALIFFLVSAFIGLALLSRSIQTSFSSLSRNPLASSMINRNLFKMTLISVVVLVIGSTAGYLTLML